ncbi:hypothetical protein SAY87_015213 [Trapa incisa]|uniref:GDSL esterase/lipase n=1 Tax=Trapa incisa TaxID=236973 RepID=A0AAN7JL87_9MYRT|nr:hypothetical protein SAY87_015213 [Trapa incisa]
MISAMCYYDHGVLFGAECDSYFKTSLFMVGEIGGNDYNIPFLFTRAPIQQVRPFIPFVIQAIVNATTALIEEGAVNLVVPGNLPLGCVPAYNQSTYNPKTGCMDSFNAFSKHHNQMLIQALQRLRKRYPQARIAYLDFYGAAIKFYYKPESYGFTRASMLTSCCRGGGPFNFNSTRQCGAPGSTLCEDPSSYVSWDGVHLTEAAYRFMAKGLLL